MLDYLTCRIITSLRPLQYAAVATLEDVAERQSTKRFVQPGVERRRESEAKC